VVVVLPAGWERALAPVATALARFGSPLGWWIAAIVLLLAGLAMATRAPRWAPVLAAIAALALGIASDGLVDDAYIQFRYAANLAADHGPVFNPGERIEGASGGIWIGALALGPALFATDPGVWGRFLSLALTALAALAAGRAMAAAAGARAGAVAALVWAALPTTALYAATGLETAAYGLALWLAAWAVASRRPRLAWIPGTVTAALRPEGLVLGAVAAPWLRRLGRPARALVLGTLAGAGAIALARWATYGALLPRSVTVKGFTAAAGIGSGIVYLGKGLLEWFPLLVGVPLLVRRRALLAPALAAAGGWTALVAMRGGDWMPGSRYLLPLLVVLTGATAATEWRWARAAAAATAAWGCLLLAPIPDPAVKVAGAAWRPMAEHRVQSQWWEALGGGLSAVLPPGTTLASGPSGALPYTSGMPAFDMYGLCSVVTQENAGPTGHRLWGLRQAAGKFDVIYIGKSLPQVRDPKAVAEAAERQTVAIPGFRLAYEPVVVMHEPESSVDVVADVLWVRPALASRFARLPAARRPQFRR